MFNAVNKISIIIFGEITLVDYNIILTLSSQTSSSLASRSKIHCSR